MNRNLRVQFCKSRPFGVTVAPNVLRKCHCGFGENDRCRPRTKPRPAARLALVRIVGKQLRSASGLPTSMAEEKPSLRTRKPSSHYAELSLGAAVIG